VSRRLGPLRLGALGFAVCGLALAACAGSGEHHAGGSSGTARSTTSTTRRAVPVAPLTGLGDPGGSALRRQSLGVKIENTPDARPQTGLDQADIVYEEVVEGGITRFWAFFDSKLPETVGPIRSVRSMDPNIILPFGGVVAFSGGTPDNVALVRATGLVTVDEGNAGAAFFRDPARPAPHNLYGRTEAILGFGGTPVPPVAMFTYRPAKQSSPGEPVASFHVGLQAGYDVSYVWDPARGGWARYSQGLEPFLAAGTPPVQVAPANVVVQFIPYGSGADGDVMGTGEAWVFTDGRLVRGTWGKAFPEAAPQLADAAGAPILLTPGRTWVELAPIGTPVDVLPSPATSGTTVPSTTAPSTASSPR
jgi:Protein of unknown function (DUF3048) N-terminal domain/Protein of unknown function (DUF3048) C-terminal domain